MSISVYDINSWVNGNTYNVNDIVSYGGKNYYALSNNFVDGARDTPNNSLNWGGMLIDINGENKPNFVWTPSYGRDVKSTPRIKMIQFGEGYSQRFKDSINNNLITLDLSFENRDINEATAISYFLRARQGYESFIYKPAAPYNSVNFNFRFICKTFSDIYTFYNNFGIKTTFEQVAV